MPRNGTKSASDRKDGFLFLGNQLALDWLNTRPLQNGQATELLTDFEAFLRWFQAAGLLGPRELKKIRQRWAQSERARQMLEHARELRERLRKEVLAWEAGAPPHRAMTDELNRLMAEHPMLTQLKTLRNGVVLERRFETKQPEDLFAPLADGAAALFSEVSRDRVRKCGECVLHFYDTSKKGTRRWCSMQLCGNRLKVAAYGARQKKS
jgi:predicted RNA-binding Zn ribbon-like protein